MIYGDIVFDIIAYYHQPRSFHDEVHSKARQFTWRIKCGSIIETNLHGSWDHHLDLVVIIGIGHTSTVLAREHIPWIFLSESPHRLHSIRNNEAIGAPVFNTH